MEVMTGIKPNRGLKMVLNNYDLPEAPVDIEQAGLHQIDELQKKMDELHKDVAKRVSAIGLKNWRLKTQTQTK